jgi:excisionase family DNA binding protein
MGYSLGEAAKEIGVSKPTVQRAIKSGRLSATRHDDGSYDIDPAELRRAFPPVTPSRNVAVDLKRQAIPVPYRPRLRDCANRWRC